MNREDFTRYIYELDLKSNLKIATISFKLVAEQMEGKINVTDMQLQEGAQVTGTVPNSREFLERMYNTIDEGQALRTVSNPVKRGVQPNPMYATTPMRNRFFNFAGRGHEVIAMPNIYHEDYNEDLVTSALDLTIYAKDDFDLLRVSTNDGALIEGRLYDHEKLLDHPLNYRYTREFYYEGAKAGQEIKLHANAFTASLAGKKLPLGIRQLDVKGNKVKTAQQRFMMAPYGSFRIRLEFYKTVTEEFTDQYGDTQQIKYLKNTGIGYYGYGNFEQFKGRAKY